MQRLLSLAFAIAVVGTMACGDEEMAGPCQEMRCMQPAVDGGALFAESCGTCHTLEVPILASISDIEGAWHAVRTCMPESDLSDHELAAIAEYLCDANGECVR